MDTRTGNIALLAESMKDIKPEERKWFKQIPETYLSLLKGMNRKERREWYKKNKKKWEKQLQKEKKEEEK